VLPDSHLAIASHLLAASHFILRHAPIRQARERRNGDPQNQQAEHKNCAKLRHRVDVSAFKSME
jgi:hypothetical protein